jgi:hypothetical protein
MNKLDLNNQTYSKSSYKSQASINTIVFVVIGILLIVNGIYIIVDKNPRKVNSVVNVVNECDPASTNPCLYTISYIVNTVPYVRLYSPVDKSVVHQPGDIVTIFYDPNNPKSPGDDLYPLLFGSIFIGIGLLLIIGILFLGKNRE